MMPHRSYRRVSPEVRRAAVEQVLALTGKLRSESEACRVVAEQIGVHTNSVRNWVRAAAEGPGLERMDAVALRRKVALLQQQLAAAAEMNRTLVETLNDAKRAT
ncbi:transposase [Nocardia sp. NPDC051570]|uniref:transposase n=1 Tax=Nocardia sp. NPDC051570 TaxID=3364324 RepID=UPI00378FEBA1